MMDLYQEIILDHFKHPRNHGLVEGAEITGEDFNPLCGDKIQISLKLNIDGGIAAVGFSGSGCAISQASMSLLSEEIVGKSLKEVVDLSNEKIYELVHTEVSPARVKCALLGLSTVKKAIKLYQTEHGKK